MMKEPDKCLDSQLWHACAGGMVQMPPVNSKVFYFPQGHAEHAQGNVDFGMNPRIPSQIFCRVTSIKYMADPETDEVFTKIRLVPVKHNELDLVDDEFNGQDAPEKLASFAKTLTQSDANNGGGFSVPRYCAETIFPRLDYTANPPVQTVLVRDIHGEQWKFRHIYRGTPRRHLLTTGWSTFVNQKKLMAGDSIVFLRTENGEIRVGIRRAKRGIGNGPESPSGWNTLASNCLSQYSSFSVFSMEEESKLIRNNRSYPNANPCGVGGDGRWRRVRPESVVEAANLAANGQPFEIVYYPRASTPEFCVKASAMKVANRIHWATGMRFKMFFETEDSSRISWFMGSITGIQFADPILWPHSPWRILQVTWDEPDSLQNVKRVSPWLVELVSNIPLIHLSPYSPPEKKSRISQYPDFSVDGQFPSPVFSGNPFAPGSNHLCCLSNNTPAGIQGARHGQFGISFSDLHLNKLQSGAFPSGFRYVDNGGSVPRIPTGLIIRNHSIHDNVSCFLTIGNSSPETKKPCNDTKPTSFLLFGKTIITENLMSTSYSEEMVSPFGTRCSSSDGNPDRTTNVSDDSWPPVQQRGLANNRSCNGFSLLKEHQFTDLSLQTGHCKVFMESEDVGRTLDLSALSSYNELSRKLADMFDIEKTNMNSHVQYRNSAGEVKHTGDEPFGDFKNSARKLIILMDSGSDN